MRFCGRVRSQDKEDHTLEGEVEYIRDAGEGGRERVRVRKGIRAREGVRETNGIHASEGIGVT